MLNLKNKVLTGRSIWRVFLSYGFNLRVDLRSKTLMFYIMIHPKWGVWQLQCRTIHIKMCQDLLVTSQFSNEKEWKRDQNGYLKKVLALMYEFIMPKFFWKGNEKDTLADFKTLVMIYDAWRAHSSLPWIIFICKLYLEFK